MRVVVVTSRSRPSLCRTSGWSTSRTVRRPSRRVRSCSPRKPRTERPLAQSAALRAASAGEVGLVAERADDDAADLAEVVLVEAAHRRRRRADADARGDRRRALVERHRVAVDASATSCSRSSASLPVHSVRRRSSCSRCVSVPPVSTSRPPSSSPRRARRRWRAPALVVAEGLGWPRCGSTSPWPPWRARAARPGGPGRPRGRSLRVLLAAEDEAGARAGERLVRGRGDDVAVVDRVRVQPGRDEAGEVRHVAPEQRADLVGDLAELPRVDLARVRGAAAQDQLRPVLRREREHLVVVDQVRLARDAVVDDRVEAAREVDLEPVREVAAVVEAERRGPCRPARAGPK